MHLSEAGNSVDWGTFSNYQNYLKVISLGFEPTKTLLGKRVRKTN